MLKQCLLVGVIFCTQILEAQQSEKLTAAPTAVVHMQSIKNDFAPVFFSTEMPAPGSTSYRRHLMEIKDSLYGNRKFPGYNSVDRITTEITAPEILTGWEGNLMTSYVPNDNDLAISNMV